MVIDKCKNCGSQFKYRDLLKGFFSLRNDLYCRNCGASHEMKLISRIIPILLILLPSFISIWSENTRNFIRNAFPNFLSLVLMVLIYSAIIVGLSLLISRYRLKDNN